MYERVLLSSENAEAFQYLTFRSYRPLLNDASPSGNVIGLGLCVENQPIGFGLARILADAESEMLSVFVSTPYRGKGLGTQLLTQLEEMLCYRGCIRSRAIYTTQTRSTAIVEHLLQKTGWTPPQRRLVIFRFDRRILTAPWLRRVHVNPPYEVVPWSEVREDELESVRTRRRAQACIPEYLLPFEQADSPHCTISVALRCNGELVGWLIGHAISPDTVRYTKLWIDGNLVGARLLGMALIAEAIRRQVRDLGPNSYVICGVRAENGATIRLLERLRPESERESRIVRKANLLRTCHLHPSGTGHEAGQPVGVLPYSRAAPDP